METIGHRQTSLTRYNNNITNPRAPGTGCHSWIMSTANLGVLAGMGPQELHDDIRHSIHTGTRRISDREITDAINKALQDLNGGTFTPRPRPEPIVNDGKTALQGVIDQGEYSDEADLWESSPIRLLDEPEQDRALFLETLFEPEDYVFIGERHEAGIKTVRDRIDHLRNGGKAGPLICINPMTGKEGLTKDGKPSFRCDNAVKSYRYAMAEFDNLTREDQIRFWSAAKLPIVALIDSGGKSIHAWLDVQKLAEVKTPEQWQSEIKGRLYDRVLSPLGVDTACSNPARLSRLPGHLRAEKGRYQRLLWLSSEGKAIC